MRYMRWTSLAVAGALMAGLAGTAQDPKDGPKADPKVEGKGRPGGPGGPGGFRGFARPKPGEVLAVSIQDSLRLTDEQKKKVAELQKEVDDKLASILTDDQKKQLKDMQERAPGFGGPGGPGGFGRPGTPGGGGRPGRPGVPPKKDN